LSPAAPLDWLVPMIGGILTVLAAWGAANRRSFGAD